MQPLASAGCAAAMAPGVLISGFWRELTRQTTDDTGGSPLVAGRVGATMTESHPPDTAAVQDEQADPSLPGHVAVEQPPSRLGGRASAAAPMQLSASRFNGILSFSAILLLLSAFLPYLAERIAFAVTRGRQRAAYETAGEQLRGLPLRDLSQAYQLVANRMGPSVVHINVASAYAEETNKSPLESVWRHPSTGQGSGVIVDATGYIVTNEHVIRGSEQIRVKLSDGRTVVGKVVGVDAATDMAVLKIDADKLLAAEWGNSDELDVGALVWALGSPFGLEHSVTFGILSAKHRSGINNRLSEAEYLPYQDYLQTDAAVNPGNSGGPLVDSRGCIIGINTAIVGEAYQGISFAIPSSIARPIYERLRQEGRVARGYLGVQPQDVGLELAEQLGLPSPAGALVVRVESFADGSASPAQRAGIDVGDVIVQWDGQPVGGRTELFSRVGMTPVGSAVEVVVIRKGNRLSLRVEVAARADLAG